MNYIPFSSQLPTCDSFNARYTFLTHPYTEQVELVGQVEQVEVERSAWWQDSWLVVKWMLRNEQWIGFKKHDDTNPVAVVTSRTTLVFHSNLALNHLLAASYLQKAASERDPCREDLGERKPGEDTTGREGPRGTTSPGEERHRATLEQTE
ncbi:hypothetical protein E2C01_024931 [Portunus trituberculatus]|uniref:Uncharacterized protein n=1 Tax=Portunus trituberculatus TaxID=210409 RepID=A0A5B7EEM8_PORTR|nr:hypothetical protein [Portunus trituberculatus]